jgi:hypothetical protein
MNHAIEAQHILRVASVPYNLIRKGPAAVLTGVVDLGARKFDNKWASIHQISQTRALAVEQTTCAVEHGGGIDSYSCH